MYLTYQPSGPPIGSRTGGGPIPGLIIVPGAIMGGSIPGLITGGPPAPINGGADEFGGGCGGRGILCPLSGPGPLTVLYLGN